VSRINTDCLTVPATEHGMIGWPPEEPNSGLTRRQRERPSAMLIVILLIILAIVTGVAGALIKGAFWLFILTVLFVIGAFIVHRGARK
jgi:quinol-cytochrome oxidoreductase complex cytochrome b subunit